jgi:hypothetical protein
MRPLCFFAFACSLLGAPLQIVRTLISDSDGGAALPAGFVYRPGETLFFSCRIAGYQKTPEEKIHLTYSVQALDPSGVPLLELFKNEISDEVTPQDKEWMPKIATEIAIPPLVASGTYKIVVKAEDLVAKGQTETTIPFEVRGHEVAPSETLTVRNFHFYRSEDARQPAEKAAYQAGDSVWARFDIVGFRYGAKNKIAISYAMSVLDSSGKVLWTQPEPNTEESESFYPKRYLPAALSIQIQPNTHPGEYTIAAEVEDAVGNQTTEVKGTFTVEQASDLK